MNTQLRRRSLLAAAVGVSVAGCIDLPAGEGSNTGSDPDLPAACPTSQDLGVEWPDEVTRETVTPFVEAYEHVYYRDVVVEYEPESRVDSYDIAVGVSEGPVATGDGYELEVSGSGGVYRPTLHLTARVAPVPEDRRTVPISAVEDELLRGLLEEAAQNPDERPDRHVEPSGETVEQYLERLEALDDDFGPMDGPGDTGVVYFDVDGDSVELEAQADNFHGDYWVRAWYYVDDHVVRRTDDEATDPQSGELLECRRNA